MKNPLKPIILTQLLIAELMVFALKDNRLKDLSERVEFNNKTGEFNEYK
jgi:hypothetical protein